MIEALLQDVLDIRPNEHLEPYERSVSQQNERDIGSTETFRLVNETGETTAVIDGWCFDGACYGYVRFDASGENVIGREVFSLSRGREHQRVGPHY